MREAWPRVTLLVLALPQTAVGTWAAFAPRAFYDDFPTGRPAWVAVDGPYNQHLVRDFGALTLGLALASLVAVYLASRPAMAVTAVAWIASGIPHLAYHARNLDVYEPVDRVANVVVLSLVPLLALGVLLGCRPRDGAGRARRPEP